MRTKHSAPPAFTLIEVMVSGVVLAAGAAALLTGYYTLMGVEEHQRRLTTAALVTRGRLEEILAARDVTLIPRTQIVDHLGRPTGASTSSPLGTDAYRVDWISVADSPADDFMTVTVTTSWTETRTRGGMGTSRSTSMTTVRHE